MHNRPQSEHELEQALISQLKRLGYEYVKINDKTDLHRNFKTQLEKHNKITLSNEEFSNILNHLNKGNIFEKAKILRDKYTLKKDGESSKYIEFMNITEWCKNEYQVAHQINNTGKYTNRYDVTLLINGLPLVQIELKRRGAELQNAIKQIQRYKEDSYHNSLFDYIQIFVISNGANTKYFSNNQKLNSKFIFFWTKENNNKIDEIEKFTDTFLEKCHISKMIARYMVLHQSDKQLMVMRPYQCYAVEAIIKHTECSNNGYIWHSTGSGKTITSFKVSQILSKNPKINKVMFVVDRADLNAQTIQEFKNLSYNTIDETNSTKKLIQQMDDDNSKIIVTTIQKLNHALKDQDKLQKIKNKKVIFIFDECHRSQFGETHKKIKDFFTNNQMFGFTGTPIFKDNAIGLQTTESIFPKCLHKYLINHAISDKNVLPFSVEYYGNQIKDNVQEKEVVDIDRKEFLESKERIEKIIDYIINTHNSKTKNKKYSAIMCVSNVAQLKTYYDIFKTKKESKKHDLNIATIFSDNLNEEDKNDNGFIAEPSFEITLNMKSRDKLEEYIQDYNKLFSTNYSTNNFYEYYQNISKKIKEQEKESNKHKSKIDILLVVNMFLTGFDAKTINTLYVDKNLKYHGLIQAFSRTNRIMNTEKSHGNILCFYPSLAKQVDDAILLFSNSNAETKVIVGNYDDYLKDFNDKITELRDKYSLGNINNIQSEEKKSEFIKLFRDILRKYNELSTFSDFKEENIDINELNNYKSKYADIYHQEKNSKNEKESILNDIDFEIELLRNDEINVDYILKLLSCIDLTIPNYDEKKKELQLLIESTENLISKKQLLQDFINHYANREGNNIDQEIHELFNNFSNQEQEKEIQQFCNENSIIEKELKELIQNYSYNKKDINDRDTLHKAIKNVESLKFAETNPLVEKIQTFIKHIIDTYYG